MKINTQHTRAVNRISFWLNQLKANTKLTLEEISTKTSVSISTISRAITLSSEISISNLEKIAESFNLEIAEFLKPVSERNMEVFASLLKEVQK